jgi:NAD(P)-dependent dehydrogenase (short-subunit alcohol dehydrogenase family)
MMNVHLTSVADISTAFQQLLHNAAAPKIINITSGLGSIANTFTDRKMAKYPPYGASKVGMNGVTAHMQVWEDERIKKENAEGKAKAEGRIKFYSVAPGLLNTSFTHYSALGKDPKDGAEVVVRLIADDKGEYPGGTRCEFEQGRMREVPW